MQEYIYREQLDLLIILYGCATSVLSEEEHSCTSFLMYYKFTSKICSQLAIPFRNFWPINIQQAKPNH